jgi:two-component sensor histidine kinase
MALVHEKLYQSQDLANIDFSDYINSLVVSLFRTYSPDPDKIKLNVQVENIFLSIDLAVPCGLIIHELVSNALKHAFKDFKNNRDKKIEIVVNKIHVQGDKEQYRLVIRDNGKGIPENIEFKNSDTLGLRLAGILVEEQLMGSIQLDRSNGTQFTIYFNS